MSHHTELLDALTDVVADAALYSLAHPWQDTPHIDRLLTLLEIELDNPAVGLHRHRDAILDALDDRLAANTS